MMVFQKERLVYLAVPKTGTSAIERALARRATALFRDPPGLKHTNAQGFERKFRAIFEQWGNTPFQTCAVFREPIDWLGSWFRYRQRPALEGHKNSTAGLSFDEFVDAYLLEKQPPFAKVGAQGRFVTDGSGELLVNHLFQYERMSEFYDFLHTKLGREIETKQINVSPKAPIELSATLEARLRDQFRLDFEIHDALMDGPISVS